MPSSEFRFSFQRSATPKLSIYIPSREAPQPPRAESSRFSIESHHPPFSEARSSWTAAPPPPLPAKDLEAGTMPPATPPSTARSMHDRFAKLFFDLRTFGTRSHEPALPMQQPGLPEWPPLHIEKRPADRCCEHCRKPKKNRRRIILWALLILLLLYLFANGIVLDTRVLTNTTASTPNTSSATTLSVYAQECLSQYVINAPSTPAQYPCGQCFSILQGIPPSYLDANMGDAQQIQNALQFCGLRSVFEEMDGAGQSLLANGSWVQNVDFCAWANVACDGSGSVSSLKLSAPAVPAVLPSQISGLAGLQTLQLIGDTSIPAGALPSSFANLSDLSTIDFEGTAITTLPDDLFASLSKVTTLTLVRNANMGSNLPSSIANSSLENLIVNQQTLTNPLSTLANSSSLQSSLKLIDLSSTNLTGTIPDSIASLASLVELHFDSNNLANPLPATFPPKLEILTLTNNTALSGTVSGSFCTLTALQECSVTGTDLTKPAGGCGVCQFS